MTKPEILVMAPLPEDTLNRLDADFTAHRLWQAPSPDALFAEAGARIAGLACNTLAGRIDAAVFDRLPALRIVANFGVGYDNVDVAAAEARGVVVTNTPDVLDAEVADFTLGLLLATLRRIPAADAYLRAGQWEEAPFPLTLTLRERRVGIYGLGNIGKAIARRLEGFDVAIGYHGRARQPSVGYDYHPTLLDLARASDVLIVVVPGSAQTKGSIDAAVLDALGPQGVLINVARGSVVNEDDLVVALETGRIAAAGLDVFAHEPHVPAALVASANTVLLPHVGSASVATRNAMGKLMADNLKAWFATGRCLTPVPETRHLAEAAPTA